MEEGTQTTARCGTGETRPGGHVGEGGPYKPKVKGDRAGRESEGFIVLSMPVEKAGGGKGPCFGQAGVRR